MEPLRDQRSVVGQGHMPAGRRARALESSRQGGISFELVHHDLAVDLGDGRVRQQDLMHQAVQCGQVGAPNP